MLFTANTGGKPLHPTMPSQLPIHKIKSDGAWGGNIELDNVNFNDFTAATKCGAKQHMIKRNKYSADYTPMHKFKNTSIRNVQQDAVIFIEDPDPGWANPTDCGNWPCTAPSNVVLKFDGTSFVGSTRPSNAKSDFTIVSDVATATNAYSDCETVRSWNAAFCQNSRIGVLLFESLDSDKRDRTVSPITLTSEETGYSNMVNTFMDHVWDGFYTG
jgi:hypothetical protein